MSERVSRKKRRCSGRLGRCWGCLNPGTFICAGKGGALPTADTRFPSGFHHCRSRQTPHSGLLSLGSTHFAALLGVPTQLWGVWGREKTHKSQWVVTQAGRQESAPVPGARGDSRALAQEALWQLRPQAVSQPLERLPAPR